MRHRLKEKIQLRRDRKGARREAEEAREKKFKRREVTRKEVCALDLSKLLRGRNVQSVEAFRRFTREGVRTETGASYGQLTVEDTRDWLEYLDILSAGSNGVVGDGQVACGTHQRLIVKMALDDPTCGYD